MKHYKYYNNVKHINRVFFSVLFICVHKKQQPFLHFRNSLHLNRVFAYLAEKKKINCITRNCAGCVPSFMMIIMVKFCRESIKFTGENIRLLREIKCIKLERKKIVSKFLCIFDLCPKFSTIYGIIHAFLFIINQSVTNEAFQYWNVAIFKRFDCNLLWDAKRVYSNKEAEEDDDDDDEENERCLIFNCNCIIALSN